jgi:hypothetical protein
MKIQILAYLERSNFTQEKNTNSGKLLPEELIKISLLNLQNRF